ncbi:discoidin domain-containing protein [Ferruginibacter profundus]
MFVNATTNFTARFIVITGMVMGLLFFNNSTRAQNCNTDVTNGIAAASIVASAENAPGEGKDMAFDNIITTKWYAGVTPSVANPVYIQVDLGTAQVVTNYSITSANDVQSRDPKDFTLSGSNNGSSFTVLSTRTGEVFASRFLMKYYSFSNSTAYRYYRLSITANYGGATATQLAEIQLLPTNNCITGNVYNNAVGVGYPSIPVLARTTAGTVASTTTNASGAFAFTTANAPVTDYAILIQPPTGTYFYSGPGMNFNASVMSSDIYNYFKQEAWPTGSFLNVNGDVDAITNNYYTIDNTEGTKTPASLDWVLKPTAIVAPTCTVVATTLDGSGTFGNLSVADYTTEHALQPGFHAGPIPFAGEAHPNLFKSITTGSSGYINGNILYSNRGSLYDEGRYNITSFLGTIQDAALIFGRTETGANVNSTFNLLNGHNGGWRKTYGRTTGDVYDLFLAANGQTSATGSIVEFTANIGTTGTKYLNFYGKNANSFAQTQNSTAYSNVEVVFSVYNSSNVLVTSSTLVLSPVASAAQDNPTSPWEGRTFTFTAITTGTYTFKLTVPTTAQQGNDFYLDNIELSECPIQYTLTGKVWDDANGNAVQNTGENTIPVISSSLYVNLVDANGYIVTSVKVNADGTYSIPIPQNITGYKLVLTSDPSLNTASLPAGSGWVNTGESVNTQNTATQSGLVGVIELNTATSDIAGQNFGIEKLPDTDPKTQTVPYPTGGIITAGAITTAVSGTDFEDGALGNSNTIVITSLPANATMYYNGVAVTAGQQITGFNPALLSFTGITLGSTSVVFNYAFIDAAGKQDPTPASYTLNWLQPLPVTLQVFTATKENDKVKLSWRTLTEQNVNRFTIEYSKDGNTFTAIANVAAAGNSSIAVDYTWLHSDPVAGNNYYRLKMIDLDGRYIYSNTNLIKINRAGEVAITVYPNPVHNELTIVLPKPGTVNTMLHIYSSDGKLVYNRATGNAQTIPVQVSTFTSGVYYIRISESGKALYDTRFIKQ